MRPRVVIHTSGTTAAPRPVELTYGNFLWSALGSAVALGLDPAERWLCTLPVSHVGGLSILVRSCIYATTAVVHERFDTDRVLRCAERRGRDARVARGHDARAAARRRAAAAAIAALRADRRRAGARALARPLAPAAFPSRSPTASRRRARRSPRARGPRSPTSGGFAGRAEPPLTAGPALFCTRVQHRRRR